MTIKHLNSDYIDDIALSLDEDVYGANGDLDESQIKSRLILNIHHATGHQFVAHDMMPVWVAAILIRSVWEYMDRKYMGEISRINEIQSIASRENK